MIEFQKVTFSNFKGFGKKPTSLDLDRGKTSLIIGNNLDIGEQGSSKNGVGKSSIMSAVVFALYGKDVDKNKPDDMVNFKNQKKMWVDLEFSIKGSKCFIRRGRKPGILEFKVDGKDLTRDSMKNTDEEIMKLLDIPYDVFMAVFFLNPFKDSFMGMTAADQRNFMEKLLSLDVLADRAEALKSIKKDLAIDIKLKNKDLEHAVRSNERVQSNIDRAKERRDKFNRDMEEEIGEYTQMLEESKAINFKSLIAVCDEIARKQQDLENLKRLAPTNDGTLSAIDYYEDILEQHRLADKNAKQWEKDRDSKLQSEKDRLHLMPSEEDILRKESLSNDLTKTTKEHQTTVSSIKEANAAVSSLESSIAALTEELEALDAGECPYCKQRHTDEDRVVVVRDEISRNKEKREETKAEIHTLEKQRHRLEQSIDTMNSEMPDVPDNVTVPMLKNIASRIEEIGNEVNPYSDVKANIKVTEDEAIPELEGLRLKNNRDMETQYHINAEFEVIEQTIKKSVDLCMSQLGTCDKNEVIMLKKELDIVENKIDELEKQKNPYEDQITELYDEVQDLSKIETELKELEKKEQHTGYLVKLLTDPKSFIRKNIVDQYLPFVNKRIYEYSTALDLPHVAEIQNDMFVDIDYMGKSVSYYTMSRGERLRIDASAALAFRDLMGMLGKSTNVMLVDEYVDSAIDDHGVRMMMDLLTKSCSNLFLISHREQFHELVDEVITITKNNGFSSIG